MLSTMRSSWVLFALLALIALASAFSVEEALNIDGINAYLHHGVKRQAEGTGASSSAPPPATSEAPEEPSSTAAPPPTSAPAPSSSAAPAPSSDDPTTDEPAPSTAAPAPSSAASEASSAAAPSSAAASSPSRTSAAASTPVVTTRPLVSTEVAATTTVITITSNGQTFMSTSAGSRTVEHTTGQVTETSLAGTSNGDGGSGGLSSEKKAIIGGVIGGVGGAILLGGIAIVCWRMWGKKKRISEDDADLMAGTGAALGDKTSTTSPFQSNLEQYHNPGGRPNAAANF